MDRLVLADPILRPTREPPLLILKFNSDRDISLGGRGTQRGGFAFGAIFIHGSTVHIENTLFIANSAQGGGSSGSGQIG